MTTLEIIVWGIFCVMTLYGVFKRFNLPKKGLILPMFLATLPYVIPLYFFWGNSSATNFTYGGFFLIMLITLVLSWFLSKNKKMQFHFFLGVIITFSILWLMPLGWLPYRPNWEERSPAFFEKILEVRAPFHHSTLAPALTSIILLFHFCRPDWRVFQWCSKHRWTYALGLGVLIFAITSQIPEILKYGTPWW